MANEWYKDNDRMRYFIKALENKLNTIFSYSVTVDDWEWYIPKIHKTDEQYLEIKGNVSGESSYSCNYRDADDFDIVEFDFDTPVFAGHFPESMLKENTKQQFFEMMVKDFIDEIENAVEDYAANARENND